MTIDMETAILATVVLGGVAVFITAAAAPKRRLAVFAIAWAVWVTCCLWLTARSVHFDKLEILGPPGTRGAIRSTVTAASGIGRNQSSRANRP